MGALTMTWWPGARGGEWRLYRPRTAADKINDTTTVNIYLGTLSPCLSADGRRYRFRGFMDGQGRDRVMTAAGSVTAAMRAAERDICRQSIGLLDVDDVAFERKVRR